MSSKILENKYLHLVVFWCVGLLATAQVITTAPTVPVDNQSVVVTFNAAEGNQGLKDYTGDIYAHTGVITSESTSSSDWKYVQAGWSENIEKCKLTSIGDNKYTLEISPSIREFYGVPASEKIEQLAFVFRNSDGSKTGKTSSGGDIFQDVSTVDLTVGIEEPGEASVYASTDMVSVEVAATNATGITIYVDDVQVAAGAGNELTTSFSAGTVGDHIIKAEATDGTKTVEELLTYYVRSEVSNLPLPDGLKRGVNKVDDQSVTMVLFAPDKDFVHVIGEFNNWMPNDDYLMHKDGGYFWLTISSLNANEEYAFQFYIDGEIRVADPYTNKTLDPDDKYIPESVYPGLKDYPEGLTSHAASVFKINEDSYDWNVAEFTNPEITKMVIYELHVRDFTANGDIKTVTDSISYFKELGVNAIELMPFNEFEGNDSWGYNPSFYFAPDKAYGTANDYKEFIDVCHQNGIAVIMDMVLNHSFGQSPFARMYLDGGKPASNNPWYNRDHNMLEPAAQWGYDFNHESVHTEELVDSVCSFWLNEYKLDGFRFDFTKGFTNTSYPVGDWASAYDADRIAILKRIADEIWINKSDAIISFEHLSENSEEKELANYGILMWGNHNHKFNEATMGYNTGDKSDFSWASYINRGWDHPHIINYMESHDEERLMYKNKMYGNSDGNYNVKNLEVGLERVQAAAVFLMSVPGPNMIWQFGELGYDYSINTCPDGTVDETGGCRTARKPIEWGYYEDADRKSLFETYSDIITLKKEEPVFSTSDYAMEVRSATKRIELNHAGSDVRLVGNFDVVTQSIQPMFSATGMWYNHFRGDSINVTDVDMEYGLVAGDFALFSQKKLHGFKPHTSIGDPTYFKNAWIAPNPVKNQLTIYGGDKPLNKIKVTSVTGALLFETPVYDSQTQINVSGYSKGVYLVHLIGNGDGYRVFKMVKQ
ncbi:T9SS type A sorting domain-containing protein [Labilibacter sediminis]|nr:T9SS type A sorting domain-containing protein [Labilibacter sediminis]